MAGSEVTDAAAFNSGGGRFQVAELNRLAQRDVKFVGQFGVVLRPADTKGVGFLMPRASVRPFVGERFQRVRRLWPEVKDDYRNGRQDCISDQRNNKQRQGPTASPGAMHDW